MPPDYSSIWVNVRYQQYGWFCPDMCSIHRIRFNRMNRRILSQSCFQDSFTISLTLEKRTFWWRTRQTQLLKFELNLLEPSHLIHWLKNDKTIKRGCGMVCFPNGQSVATKQCGPVWQIKLQEINVCCQVNNFVWFTSAIWFCPSSFCNKHIFSYLNASWPIQGT